MQAPARGGDRRLGPGGARVNSVWGGGAI
jgi:hypothetical protein